MSIIWSTTSISLRRALFSGTFGGAPTVHYMDRVGQDRADRLARCPVSTAKILQAIRTGRIQIPNM